MKSLSLLCALILAGSGAAYAQSVSHKNGLLTDESGRVLYTFDKDSAGKSNCSGACLAAWPAFVAKVGDKPATGYSMVTREDGSLQWALAGKPLYYFAGDGKPGDANGDNSGGVWHVVKSPGAPKAAADAAPKKSGYY